MATFHGCQAVMPSMVAQRSGRIVNIVRRILERHFAARRADQLCRFAKAGLVALTQSLAKEVARLNITVNALCRGLMETDTIAGMNPEEQRSKLRRPNSDAPVRPAKKCGRGSAISGLVPRPVTLQAQSLKVDGGVL